MLTVNVSDKTMGTVKVNDQEIAGQFPADFSFATGESVRMEAIPEPGYEFTGWAGSTSGEENPVTLLMDCNKSVTALFGACKFKVTLAVNGRGTTKPEADTYTQSVNTRMVIAAVPDKGWKFDNWTGGVLSPDSSETTVVFDTDKTCTANFSRIIDMLSLVVNGNGTVNPGAGSYAYAEGSEVVLTARPAKGWIFDSWTGGVVNPKSAETKVIIDGNKACTANFSRIMHSITLVVNGQGTVTPEAGIYQYAEGSILTITAQPAKGWRFDGWSGITAAKPVNELSITIDKDLTYTANFIKISYVYWYIGGGTIGILGIALASWFIRRRS